MGDVMNKKISAVAGFLLAAYASAPVYAFNPYQGPILSRAAVTPNVMLLIDNSGSMNNLIFASDFDAGADYGQIAYTNSNGDKVLLDMQDNFIDYVSVLRRGGCNSGYFALWNSNGDNRLCVKLPDPVRSDPDSATTSRTTAQYLSFIYSKYRSRGVIDTTSLPDSEFPKTYRMKVAIS